MKEAEVRSDIQSITSCQVSTARGTHGFGAARAYTHSCTSCFFFVFFIPGRLGLRAEHLGCMSELLPPVGVWEWLNRFVVAFVGVFPAGKRMIMCGSTLTVMNIKTYFLELAIVF